MKIETQRLILRNYKMSDLQDYWHYVQMEDVGPRCGWPAYTSKDAAKERLKLETTKPLQFAIELKENHHVIGSVELMETKPDRYAGFDLSNSKEIGYLLSKDHWGHGYMPEAVNMVLEYAFLKLKLDKVYISHAQKNTNSGRVQDKVGFKIIGIVDENKQWVDSTPTMSVLRCMTKDEWENI